MFKWVILLLCVFSWAAVAEIYRSVGADGKTTYSDTPGPGAEKVQLPPVMIYNAPPLPPAQAVPGTQETTKPAAMPPPYSKMSILAPQQDETIWDNQGLVEVVVVLEPDLQLLLGHRIVVTIDGVPHGEPRVTTRMHFSDLDRGTHAMGVKVIDQKGKALIAAKPVTFHMHRESVLFPNRQKSPLTGP